MKIIIALYFCLICSANLSAQNVRSEPMYKAGIEQVFTDSVCHKLGIIYPIHKAYECFDKTGRFYIILTQSVDTVTPENDTLCYNIRGHCFGVSPSGLYKKWEIQDFAKRDKKREPSEEYSIWFWTKYIRVEDADSDGLIDPIIVYGTSGNNGTGDGRIKILVYYKGIKYAIRHQNGTLDYERTTSVDRYFYTLPESIQHSVKDMIKEMEVNRHSNFPYGWQNAMQKHSLHFDEN